jgi:hypothetical protein
MWQSSPPRPTMSVMTQTVVHPERVAWDAARAFVRAARSPYFLQYADRVYQLLGPKFYEDLHATRARLDDWMRRPPADRYMFDVEAGKWRVVLQELMFQRPELIGSLQNLAG